MEHKKIKKPKAYGHISGAVSYSEEPTTSKHRHRHHRHKKDKDQLKTPPIDRQFSFPTGIEYAAHSISLKLPSFFNFDETDENVNPSEENGSNDIEVQHNPMFICPTPLREPTKLVSTFSLEDTEEMTSTFQMEDFSGKYVPPEAELSNPLAIMAISTYQMHQLNSDRSFSRFKSDPHKPNVTGPTSNHEENYLAVQMPFIFMSSNFSTLIEPPPNEIRKDDGGYLDCITLNSFRLFHFGSNADLDADRLHLCAWHNIGDNGKPYAEFLRNYAYETDKTNSLVFKAIFHYLYNWLFGFPTDFVLDSELTVIVLQIVECLSNKTQGEMKKHSMSLHDFIFSLNQKKITPFDLSVPLKIPQVIKMDLSTPKAIGSMLIDPHLLAFQFMFAEANLIHHITPNEFVNLNWMKETKTELCPYYCRLINHFNKIANFIVDTISKNSYRALEYWIRVMEASFEIRNYQLFYEIDAALSHPIASKKENWVKILPHLKNEYQELHEMTVPVSTRLNRMKELMLESPRQTVPYLGVFLTDLYMRDQRSSKIVSLNGNDAINLKYQKEWLVVLDAIFGEWSVEIDFKIDVLILTEIVKISGNSYDFDDPFGLDYIHLHLLHKVV